MRFSGAICVSGGSAKQLCYVARGGDGSPPFGGSRSACPNYVECEWGRPRCGDGFGGTVRSGRLAAGRVRRRDRREWICRGKAIAAVGGRPEGNAGCFSGDRTFHEIRDCEFKRRVASNRGCDGRCCGGPQIGAGTATEWKAADGPCGYGAGCPCQHGSTSRKYNSAVLAPRTVFGCEHCRGAAECKLLFAGW